MHKFLPSCLAVILIIALRYEYEYFAKKWNSKIKAILIVFASFILLIVLIAGWASGFKL